MVRTTWSEEIIGNLSKGKPVKTIEQNWEGKTVKEIWQEAKILLGMPPTSIIIRQMVNDKLVNGDYILQENDELFLVATKVDQKFLEKLCSDKIL